MAIPGQARPTLMGMLSAWFFRPIFHLLRWLGVKPLGLTHQTNSIKVFVKISEGAENVTVPMDLPRDWTVGQVKEYLVSFYNKCNTARPHIPNYSLREIANCLFRLANTGLVGWCINTNCAEEVQWFIGLSSLLLPCVFVCLSVNVVQ